MLFLFFFVNTMYNQQSKFIHHGQSLQFALHCLPFLRAQPQRAAAHPPQRLQARGCARARRRIRHGVLLHVGLRGRHAQLALTRTNIQTNQKFINNNKYKFLFYDAIAF